MASSSTTALLDIFPVPRFLEMPAVGLDISDFSVKFIEFVKRNHRVEVARFGEKKIPPGVVRSGTIEKPDELRVILTELRKEHNLSFIRGSLPEERGYLFETTVPAVRDDELRSSLEFKLEENVPLKPTAAVFDYDVIQHSAQESQKNIDVVVSAFSASDVQSYVDLFTGAGLLPTSLEIEAQAIARAVIAEGDLTTSLMVDFGRARSGISIVSGGVVRFTTTIDFGGDRMTRVLQKYHADATPEEITRLKNEVGIEKGGDNSELTADLLEVADALRGEIEKYRLYWQTHDVTGSAPRVARDPVARAVLCGGNANIAGLPEYLAQTLRMPVERANVWTNGFPLDEYLPPISFNDSLGFASAIGLALPHKR